ncbi:hypothetical protein [Micromonospora yangpuensis]|uniref:Uncharacterized protein n=1 Tax=Micromonospora yangpuensis TaxID=683228 RepID=A0A1C6UTX5_9ACTN|nr:hypothetical protein [Micromonospora yangpuensis]GGM24478.1 hypothetical protein GCM10012279_48560 [Micromonospora yangpuensis]SCL57502.1 hypothetical protein GA0070617_3544 [Micromonospora yangpuensis]
MFPDEFDEAIAKLPIDLYQRVRALRPHLDRPACPDCLRITDPVELALLAARYGELSASGKLIAAAERLAAAHPHDAAEPDPQPETAVPPAAGAPAAGAPGTGALAAGVPAAGGTRAAGRRPTRRRPSRVADRRRPSTVTVRRMTFRGSPAGR